MPDVVEMSITTTSILLQLFYFYYNYKQYC